MAGSGVAGEAACTLMINTDKVQVPTAGEIQKKLENKDPRSKADGLKQIILGALAGEDMGSQLMTVIRFCINEEDKEVKKLLMIFWEVIKKHDASGKLRPEMMLVWCVPRRAAQMPHLLHVTPAAPLAATPFATSSSTPTNSCVDARCASCAKSGSGTSWSPSCLPSRPA